MKLQGARQLIFFLTFFGGLPETRSGGYDNQNGAQLWSQETLLLVQAGK
jgi:hypothetical protein